MTDTKMFNITDDGLGICKCETHPTHYTIPSFRKYCISEKGELFSHLNNIKSVKWHPKEKDVGDTYYRSNIVGDSGVKKWISRHVAILSAHKGFDSNLERKYVNHKDCVPGNDDLNNLEWCTHEENMKHAWGNHRMEMIYQPLDVWDVKNDKVERYNTISTFIRETEIHPKTLFRRLLADNAIVYDGQYRYKRGSEEWSNTDISTFKCQYSHLGREVLVYDLRTHRVEKYPTVKAASIRLDIRPSIISDNCLKKHTTPCKGYIFRYCGDEQWPMFDYLQCELLKQQNYPQVMMPGCAFFDQVGNCVFLGTYERAAEHFNLAVRTLQNYISTGNNVCGYNTRAIRKHGSCEVDHAC